MFYFDDFFGKKVLKSTILKEVEHFFTTRDFILAAGELTEKQELAAQNREFLCEKLKIKPDKLITSKQIHSNNVEIIDLSTNIYDSCDGLITNIKDTALLLNFADCVPIILFDSVNNVASIVHAGWRGTANQIVKEATALMISKMGSKPQNIKVAIGPAIGEFCFSVDEDVYHKLIKKDLRENATVYHYDSKEDKYYIDLKNLNKLQLLDTGISEIDVCGYCTYCMSDIFFSYRKESGITARHSAVVKLGKRR